MMNEITTKQDNGKVSTKTNIPVRTFQGSQTAILAAIDASTKATSTKEKYKSMLAGYLATGGSITDSDALASYAAALSSSARLQFRAAVKLWAARQINVLKNNVTPETTATTQAAIWRLESLTEAIPTNAASGEKVHVWLTAVEQDLLLGLVDMTRNKGKRDNVLLRLLLGAGLRREEAAALTFEQIKLLGTVPVLEINGKGNKNRIVPIGQRLADLLHQWRERAGNGRILRGVKQKGTIGDSLDSSSIFRIVRRYGKAIGRPELAPHDLRRTFAENLRRNGADVPAISKLLGHESIETTMRYLNHKVDTSMIAADFLPW